MAKNKDGLEPGQRVDFQTLLRIEKNRGKRGGPKPAHMTAKPEEHSTSTQDLKAEHQGGGWYIVKNKSDGSPVSGKLRQKDARALIEQMQSEKDAEPKDESEG